MSLRGRGEAVHRAGFLPSHPAASRKDQEIILASPRFRHVPMNPEGYQV
jgi:hypothetical protein